MKSQQLVPGRIFKFASVGLLATLTHALVYLALINLANTEEQIANAIGFLIAFSVSYFGQRHWTFSERKVSNETHTKIKFFVSSLLSLGLNALWVFVTVDVLALEPEYAVVGIMFMTPLVVYFVLSLWVFV